MKHLLRDVITVYPTPALDGYGRRTFSASAVYRGRFVYKNKLMVNHRGEQVQTDAVVYLPSNTSGVNLGDRLDFSGQSYEVIGLSAPKNDIGYTQFYQCYIRRSNT